MNSIFFVFVKRRELITVYDVCAEHAKPGSERRHIVDTVDRDELDDLDDPPAPVCYYIVSGNDEGIFNIEPLSHQITVCTKHISPLLYTRLNLNWQSEIVN